MRKKLKSLIQDLKDYADKIWEKNILKIEHLISKKQWVWVN